MVNEHIRAKVTTLLRRDKVQLWAPPYFQDDCSVDLALQELSARFSKEMIIPEDTVLLALKDLQQHSLNKLQQLDKYKGTGVATLKLDSMQAGSSSTESDIESRLDVTVAEFKAKVAEAMQMPESRMVLIASGNVLQDSKTLYEQEVRNCSHILVINSEEKQSNEDKLRSEVESCRADAKLLASGSLEDEHSIEITDQSGKNMQLPVQEKKSLSVALALHEKGRKYLKTEDYQAALPVLLEADKEFSVCRSELLKAVDNYALLHMDICWCYVNLKRIQCLPDAERRLAIITASFSRTYGDNLERLAALKGCSDEEAALFMRLHLIEGIVAFHKGETNHALQKFHMVEKELRSLEVDDDAVAAILGMGYTLTQARVALRVKKNNANDAINYIIEKEQKKAEEKKKRKKELEVHKKLLGATANGDPVDKGLVLELIQRGFSFEVALASIKRCNNNISDALGFLQSSDASQQLRMEDAMSVLKAMGFNEERVRRVLEKHNGNQTAALQDLLENGAFSELDGGETSTSSEERAKQKLEEEKKKLEAFSRLSDGIANSPDDYLDISTDIEKQILTEYQTLLHSSIRR